MFRRITLEDVGPVRHLSLDLAPRLNVLTGDNGLGKSFLLDAAWWLLANQWPDKPAYPYRHLPGKAPAPLPPSDPDTEFDVAHLLPSADATAWRGKRSTGRAPSLFGARTARDADTMYVGGIWERAEWRRLNFRLFPAETERIYSGYEGPNLQPVVAVYARHDGSFAWYDSLLTSSHAVFSKEDLWSGREEGESGQRRTVIRGLLDDWVEWQRSGSSSFDVLRSVLEELADDEEPLTAVEPGRVDANDRRDVPMLQTRYGVVPVTLASSAVQRALGLAYLMVWAWKEHRAAAEATGEAPARSMCLLVDEPELHLHPRWQRTIVPSLLEAASVLDVDDVQLLTTTHSPLVLASLESRFDEARDRLFDLDINNGQVTVGVEPFVRQGDVSGWLTSGVFDLRHARSKEAEAALIEAEEALRQHPSDLQMHDIHHRLHQALGDTDPFWARWLWYAEHKGLEP